VLKALTFDEVLPVHLGELIRKVSFSSIKPSSTPNSIMAVRPFGTCAKPIDKSWKQFKPKLYSCVCALLAEACEIPLSLLWEGSNFRYWAKSISAGDNHPGKVLLLDCLEYQALGKSFLPPHFGLACVRTAKEMGLDSLLINPLNKVAIWPFWTLETSHIHLDLLGKTSRDNVLVTCNESMEYINTVWSQSLHV